MKTIQEQIAVMQHFADGGKIEMQRTDGSWKLGHAVESAATAIRALGDE